MAQRHARARERACIFKSLKTWYAVYAGIDCLPNCIRSRSLDFRWRAFPVSKDAENDNEHDWEGTCVALSTYKACEKFRLAMTSVPSTAVISTTSMPNIKMPGPKASSVEIMVAVIRAFEWPVQSSPGQARSYPTLAWNPERSSAGPAPKSARHRPEPRARVEECPPSQSRKSDWS
jgi:hypothetical protein